MKVQNTFKISLGPKELRMIATYYDNYTSIVLSPQVIITDDGLLFGHETPVYHPDENQHMPELMFTSWPAADVELVSSSDDLPLTGIDRNFQEDMIDSMDMGQDDLPF